MMMIIIIMTMIMMMSSLINWLNTQLPTLPPGHLKDIFPCYSFVPPCPWQHLVNIRHHLTTFYLNCSPLGWQWWKCTNIHCYIAAFPLRLTLTGLNLLLNTCILHCCDSRCAALLDLAWGSEWQHCHWEPTVCSSSASQLCSIIYHNVTQWNTVQYNLAQCSTV